MLLRIAIGIALALHGAIHVIGFVAPWRLALIQGMPDPALALFGHVHLGEGGARIVGVFWLAAGAAFVVAAVGVMGGAPWAVPLTLGAAIGSTVLCVVGAPAALPGVIVNVLVMLLFGYAHVAGSALRALH